MPSTATADLSPKAAEIVASARAYLAAGGYNSFSYANLSDDVHIAKASIHHHFPTKADLVCVVVQMYRQEVRDGLSELSKQVADARAQLRAYADYWIGCIRDNTSSFCVCVMLASELPVIPANIADEVKGFFRDLSSWLASVLSKGVANGSFVLETSSEREAESLMAAVHGAMLSARAYGGDADVFDMIVQSSLKRLERTS